MTIDTKNRLPRLPAELTDMVIDNLWDHKQSLAATSLVARAWLPRSRVHKFSQVRVKNDFSTLLEHLQSTPLLRPYVQKLILQGPDVYDVDDPMDEDAPRPQGVTLSPLLLAEILSQLPHLHELQLHHLSLHAHTQHQLPPYPLRRLEKLALMNVGSSHDTTYDVLRVLFLFSDIAFLHLDSLAQAWAPPGRWSANRRIRVGALRLDNVPNDVYLEVMRAVGTPRTMRSVEAEVADVEDAAALASLTAEAGPALEHVTVDLTHCFRPSYYAEDPDEIFVPGPHLISDTLSKGLEACSSLRSAEFVVPAAEADEESKQSSEPSYVANAWSCLTSVLDCLPKKMQDLTIRLSSDSWDEEPVPVEELDLDWDSLRDVLVQFDRLRSVTIGPAHGSPSVLSEEDREYVERQLDVWQKKHVLHVEVPQVAELFAVPAFSS